MNRVARIRAKRGIASLSLGQLLYTLTFLSLPLPLSPPVIFLHFSSPLSSLPPLFSSSFTSIPSSRRPLLRSLFPLLLSPQTRALRCDRVARALCARQHKFSFPSPSFRRNSASSSVRSLYFLRPRVSRIRRGNTTTSDDRRRRGERESARGKRRSIGRARGKNPTAFADCRCWNFKRCRI